jgi:hypothetical protein
MELIDFEWQRCLDGYRVVRSHVESASKRFERNRPLETPALFAKFAKDTSASAEGMLEFCNQFGLLGGGRPDIPRHIRGSNSLTTYESARLDDLLLHHATMRRAFYLFERGNASELIRRCNADGLAGARIEFRQGPNGKLDWFVVPADLIRAMWMQFAMHACSEAHLFGCERCGKPFRVGTGTGRRSTAKYCSNACKVAAFKARRQGRTDNA